MAQMNISSTLYNDTSEGVIAFAEQLRQQLIHWNEYPHVVGELGQDRPNLQNDLNALFLSVYEKFLTFLNDADATSSAINTWKEIERFLADYADTGTLKEIVDQLNANIESRLNVVLENSTGNSTTNGMSQKAITDALGTKQNVIQDLSDIRSGVAKVGYYECPTQGSSAAKAISANNYVLSTGGSMKVKMVNANTTDNATLDINNTGAKPLYYVGKRASANNSWEAGETVEIYYDGTSYYANNVAGGSSDGVFDVSVKYPTSGVDGGNTYTLEGALSVLNANLLSNKKEGGMSIKFIQSSDNNSTKYVQYRLMADAFTTDTTQWQGVDDELTAGSNNLAKSGATYLAVGGKVSGLDWVNQKGISPTTGGLQNNSQLISTNQLIPINTDGKIYFVYNGNSSFAIKYNLGFFDEEGDFIERMSSYVDLGVATGAPTGTKFVRMCFSLYDGSTSVGGDKADYDLTNVFFGDSKTILGQLIEEIKRAKGSEDEILASITQIVNNIEDVPIIGSNKLVRSNGIALAINDVNGWQFNKVDTSSIQWENAFRSPVNFTKSSSELQRLSKPVHVFKGQLIVFPKQSYTSSVVLGEVSSDGATYIRPIIINTNESHAYFVPKDMYVEITGSAQHDAYLNFYIFNFSSDPFVTVFNRLPIAKIDASMFELGNFTTQTNSCPKLSNSTSRVRTKIDSPVHLRVGDAISAPNNYRMYLAWYSPRQGWTSKSWFTSYTIVEEADYYILARYNPETDIEDVGEFASGIKVKYAEPNDKQDKLVSEENIKSINGESILGSGTLTIKPTRKVFVKRPMLSIAHRGCHILLNPTRNIPEGSEQAFIQAAKNGFDTIEFDIQYTLDGVPVIFHDSTINNVARNADGSIISEDVPVTETSYSELMQYDYGIQYGQAYAGTKLLTLSEAVDIAKRLGCNISAEIKRGFSSDGSILNNRLTEVIDIVESYDMLDNCIWQIGFSTTGMAMARRMLDYKPGINFGLLNTEGADITESLIENALTLLNENNQVYITTQYSALTATGISLAKNAGLPIHIWTVNSTSYILNDMDLYVSGVISDHTAAQKLLRDTLIESAVE